MDGQDLSVLLDGEEPEPRPCLTIGWHGYVYARDDRYIMFGPNTGRRTKLFDLKEDPGQKNIAWRNSGIVDRMFREYVLKDAGGHCRTTTFEAETVA